jgi:hypothetical protein
VRRFNTGAESEFLEYGTIEKFFNEIVPVHPTYVLTTHKRPSNINKYISQDWKVIHPRM